jgi:hypothetical protein
MDTDEAVASPEQYRKTWLSKVHQRPSSLLRHRILLFKFFNCEVVAKQKFVGPNLEVVLELKP